MQSSACAAEVQAKPAVSPCSHVPPCRMVPAAGMPAAGFKQQACARSKATEWKGTMQV